MASCSQLGLELYLSNANNEDESYQADKCIICQESRSCSVTTAEQGRRKVLEAAAVRRDIVNESLQLVEENFVYHVSNECYKKYTLKKSLEAIRKRSHEQPLADTDQNDADSSEPLKRKRRLVKLNFF